MEEFTAEIPKPSSVEVKSLAPAMSFTHEEDDRNKTEESNRFVAINIEALSLLSAINDKDSTPSPRASMMKNLSRKGSQRSGGGVERKAAEGETTNSSLGGPLGDEKPAALLHVAGEGESGLIHTSTPTAAVGRCRRHGRRQTPRLNPTRILLVFASLSSMGTLLLLYFTLSMGKAASGDTDAR